MILLRPSIAVGECAVGGDTEGHGEGQRDLVPVRTPWVGSSKQLVPLVKGDEDGADDRGNRQGANHEGPVQKTASRAFDLKAMLGTHHKGPPCEFHIAG